MCASRLSTKDPWLNWKLSIQINNSVTSFLKFVLFGRHSSLHDKIDRGGVTELRNDDSRLTAHDSWLMIQSRLTKLRTRDLWRLSIIDPTHLAIQYSTHYFGYTSDINQMAIRSSNLHVYCCSTTFWQVPVNLEDIASHCMDLKSKIHFDSL